MLKGKDRSEEWAKRIAALKFEGVNSPPSKTKMAKILGCSRVTVTGHWEEVRQLFGVEGSDLGQNAGGSRRELKRHLDKNAELRKENELLKAQFARLFAAIVAAPLESEELKEMLARLSLTEVE